jgi:hypothetical protein
MAGQKQAETSRNQQKKRMGQSGIALQYAENHDGIEGYFNPVGGGEGCFEAAETACDQGKRVSEGFLKVWGRAVSKLWFFCWGPPVLREYAIPATRTRFTF